MTMTTSSYGNHRSMDLKTLGKTSKINSRTTTLDFRRAECNLFRDLIGRIPPEAKGPRKADCSSRITSSKQKNGPF